MKHFQLLLSFTLSLFFWSLNAQNASTDHVIVYNTDNYMGDMTATFDGGLLIAGYFGTERGFEGETAFVQKFNSQHQLVWSCVLDTIPILNPNESIINIQVVPQKDGSSIALISRFDCDIITYDFLVGISPSGQVIWHKELIGIVAGKLINWAPYACAVYDAQEFLAFGADGQNLAYTQEGELPVLTMPLPDGRDLESNTNRVWLVDPLGQQIGNYWESPENIYGMDTLPGGGFMVITDRYIFKLSPSLVLYDYDESLDADLPDYEIHAYGDGYLALKRSDSQPSLLTWDYSLLTTNTFKIRSNIIRYSWFNHQQNFFIRGDQVTMATSLAEGECTTLWTASFPANSTGIYATNVNLDLKNVTHSGVPKGYITGSLPNFPEITTYQVDYTDVSAEIQNAGTDTIYHFILNVRMKSCESFPFCPGGDVVWRQPYDGLHLAPGETAVFPFDSVYANCTTSDIKDFCIWASEINYMSDDDLSNNAYCASLSDIVSTQNIPNDLAFSILPNPANDQVVVQLPQHEAMASYRIISTSGRVAGEAQTANTNIAVNSLPAGMYIMEIRTKNGTSGRQKLVIIR